MKINWKIRLKNPTWWMQIVLAIFGPIFAYFGVAMESITTWGSILDLILAALNNPIVVVSVIISVFNTINDPTTKGLSDSENAMKYSEPK